MVLWLWVGDALAKNLITNSSFEAGIDSRFAVGRWYVDGLPSARLDPTTKIHGRYSLKMPFSRLAYTPKPAKRRGMTLRSAIPIPVEKGRRYAFSLYMKSDVPAKGVLVITPNSALGYKQAPVATQNVSFSGAWRRTGVTFVAARDQDVYWEIRITTSRKGNFWLDALQMEEDAFTDYAPAGDIEASITGEATGRIYDSGERPRINLLAYNNSARTIAQSLWLDVYDIRGDLAWSTRLTRSLPAGGGIRVPVDLPQLKNGIYRAALRLEKGGEPVGELTFSVLPKPRKIPPDDSAFGAYLTIAPEPLAIARRIGLKWIASLTSNGRMIYWNRVEPEPGRFLWYDEDVGLASKLGFKLMFNLEPCRTPGWAKDFPPEQKRAKWANYVREMVRHYKNTVKYWTIGDEVGGKRCWNGVEGYARWHKTGYEAIKRTDPDAKVILNAHPRFVTRLFETLSPGTVDILAANYYHLPENVLRAMKDLGTANGIDRIWAPGVGRQTSSFYRSHIPGANRGAKKAKYNNTYWHRRNVQTVKTVVRTLDIGIERLFHYTASYVGNTNGYSIFDDDSGLKPIGAQFAALIWLLDGIRAATHLKPMYRENILSISRIDRKDNRSVFAIWGPPSRKQRLTLRNLAGKGFVLYDQYTNPLPLERRGRDVDVIFGRDPVFLVVPGNRGAATERALLSTRLYRDKLPDADRVDIKGRYAVAYGVRDGLSRPKENVSLWYKSSKLGWVEVMRQRASQVPGQYGVTERGFSITWTLGEARSKFFIEPGLIPVDLADGASYWRSRPIKGRMKWTKGLIELASLEAEPVPRRLADDPSAAPPTTEKPDPGYTYVFRFRNGLVLDMETRFLTAADGPALPTNSYGGWDIYVQADKGRKNYNVFLHTYFGASGKTRKIISLLRIREGNAQ